MSDRRLEALRRKVASVASPAMRRALSDALAAEALKLVDDGFDQGRDPYGKAWKPLKSRSGKPLLDTGRMRSAFTSRTTEDGFTLSATVRNNDPKYDANIVGVHQHGATIRPKYAKALRFQVRGAPTKGNKRGATSWVTTKKVVVPRRTMVPEQQYGGIGKPWGDALAAEADAAIRDFMSES